MAGVLVAAAGVVAVVAVASVVGKSDAVAAGIGISCTAGRIELPQLLQQQLLLLLVLLADDDCIEVQREVQREVPHLKEFEPMVGADAE